MNHTPPKDGIAGLLQNWRNDLIASIGLVLVALPLGLGVAHASNVPLIAGVTAAIIGGIVTTFVRGSHVAINGPTASLIVVVIAAVDNLGDFRYVLATFVCAGILQMLFGLLRLGKFGDFFPSSVIHGMLAAIGIIIFAKQAHVALGTTVDTGTYTNILLQIPHSILHLNPFVAIISVPCLVILIIHPRVKSKLVHFIPAPLFVLIFSIPLVYAFNFFEKHTLILWNKAYQIGPHFLVKIPENIKDNIFFPDFGKIGEPAFWGTVISVALVASIETLLAATAIDKIDPFRRKTDLNRDLFGVGFSTMVSGFIGGLPVITVIVRSLVNIQNGAKTRWANFYHGLILLVLILMFTPLLSQIPLGALAAILVFTGYKSASSKVLRDTYRKGPEQFLIFMTTVIGTLQMGLLQGIALGIAVNLAIHIVVSNMPLGMFLKCIFRPSIQVKEESKGRYHISLKEIANFFTLIPLIKELNRIPKGEEIDLDFTHTNIVDLTTMEYTAEYAKKYRHGDGEIHIIGLDLHLSFSDHPHALRIRRPPSSVYSLTKRQINLQKMCQQRNWKFDSKLNWGLAPSLSTFHFFDIRPVEYSNNIIRGSYEDLNINWEVSDITFDEVALLATHVYRITIQIINLPQKLPIFSLEREEFFDKFLEIAGYEELDFKIFTDISKKFVVKGINSKTIHEFFTPEIVNFFESQEIYHLESNGNALLVFKYLRIASSKSIEEMVLYSDRFIHLLDEKS